MTTLYIESASSLVLLEYPLAFFACHLFLYLCFQTSWRWCALIAVQTGGLNGSLLILSLVCGQEFRFYAGKMYMTSDAYKSLFQCLFILCFTCILFANRSWRIFIWSSSWTPGAFIRNFCNLHAAGCSDVIFLFPNCKYHFCCFGLLFLQFRPYYLNRLLMQVVLVIVIT